MKAHSLEQGRDVLRFSGASIRGLPVPESYRDEIEAFYGAVVESVDFQTMYTEWIAAPWELECDNSELPKIHIPGQMYVFQSATYGGPYNHALEHLTFVPFLKTSSLIVQHPKIERIECDEADVFEISRCERLASLPEQVTTRRFAVAHCPQLTTLPDFVRNSEAGPSVLCIEDCPVEYLPEHIPFDQLIIRGTRIKTLPYRIQKKILNREITFTGDAYLDPRKLCEAQSQPLESFLGIEMPAAYVHQLRALLSELKLNEEAFVSDRGVDNFIEDIYPYRHASLDERLAISFKNPVAPLFILPRIEMPSDSDLTAIPRARAGIISIKDNNSLVEITPDVEIFDHWEKPAGLIAVNCLELQRVRCRITSRPDRDETRFLLLVDCPKLEVAPYDASVHRLIINRCPLLAQLPQLDRTALNYLEIDEFSGINVLPEWIIDAWEQGRLEYKGPQHLMTRRSVKARALCRDLNGPVLSKIFDTGQFKIINQELDNVLLPKDMEIVLGKPLEIPAGEEEFSFDDVLEEEWGGEAQEFFQLRDVVSELQDAWHEMVELEEDKFEGLRADIAGSETPSGELISFGEACDRLIAALSMRNDQTVTANIADALMRQQVLMNRVNKLEDVLQRYLGDLFKRDPVNHINLIEILKSIAIQTSFSFCSEDVLRLREILGKARSDVNEEEMMEIFRMMGVVVPYRVDGNAKTLFLGLLSDYLDYNAKVQEIVERSSEIEDVQNSIGMSLKKALITGAVTVTPGKALFAGVGVVVKMVEKILKERGDFNGNARKVPSASLEK